MHHDARTDVLNALRWITENHRTANASLLSMSHDLAAPRRYLGQLLIRNTGLSFRKQLMKARMEHSAKLLTDTNAGLKEVAWACGYAYVANFVRDFRAYYSATPASFRQGWRREESRYRDDKTGSVAAK